MSSASDEIPGSTPDPGASLPDAQHAAHLQLRWTASWHQPQSQPTAPCDPIPDRRLHSLLEEEHRANFDLWHAEDLARDPQATDAEIASVKRRIDRTNQQRNDLIERMDERLLNLLGTAVSDAPLHSETPGMMLDRLSILALKIFHTKQEIDRPSASDDHRQRNRTRLQTLEEQRTDLTLALRDLLAAVAGGQRRFKLYRQLKMYNDPTLNPRIYQATPPEAGPPQTVQAKDSGHRNPGRG